MARTKEAILGQFITPQGGPATVAGAFPQVNTSQDLDLLQIIEAGDPGESSTGRIPTVIANVDYQGTVSYPLSQTSATNGTRCGQFRTRLTYVSQSNPTLAQLFADVFTNPDNSDILQIISPGGGSVYYLDYAGVAH